MDYFMVIAIICAYVVKGLCVFGNTLVFTTILSFKTNNINISPIELIVGYPANLYITWKERKSLSANIWLPLSCLVMIGSIPGALLLKMGNSSYIKLIFGIIVILVGVEMFFREYQKKKSKTSPILMGIIGIVSGLLCGLFGIGALLAAYVSRTSNNNNSFRANLCMVFFIENTFRFILYGVTGIITVTILKTAIILIPFMFAGLAVGNYLASKLDEKVVKKAVIIMLVLSGISLIIKSIGNL